MSNFLSVRLRKQPDAWSEGVPLPLSSVQISRITADIGKDGQDGHVLRVRHIFVLFRSDALVQSNPSSLCVSLARRTLMAACLYMCLPCLHRWSCAQFAKPHENSQSDVCTYSPTYLCFIKWSRLKDDNGRAAQHPPVPSMRYLTTRTIHHEDTNLHRHNTQRHAFLQWTLSVQNALSAQINS